MPPETPMPWSAKLTTAAPRDARGALRPAVQAVAEQRNDRRHCRQLVRPIRLDANVRADRRGQQHDGDDRVRARPANAADQRDVATKVRRDMDDLRARACVKSVPVGNFDYACLHDANPIAHMPHSREPGCRREPYYGAGTSWIGSIG